MKKSLIYIAIILCMSVHAFSAENEIRRIRIENLAGGLVQVSIDCGKSYQTVGRVRHPALVSVLGFAAATYTPTSAVAAVAVHGIRIKVGQEVNSIGKAGQPLMFSLVPEEFQIIPKRYGGHQPRSSGIDTDIHSGTSIFRNLAPYVGSAAFIETEGNLKPIPDAYMPQPGDIFVIQVTNPENAPLSVEFENQLNGKVTAHYAGGVEKVFAHVVRPVEAIGRYDGTTFNGVGSINTNHGGVITVSTAPKCTFDTIEGGPVETRGGFMIQPVYHTDEQRERKPQVMAIAADETARPLLEGTQPLFRGNIPLTFFEDDITHSCRAELKIDNGDWELVPKIVGRVDDAFTPAYLSNILGRKVENGVTSIRILIPDIDPVLAAKDLDSDVADYNRSLVKIGLKPVSGIVTVRPKKNISGAMTVFYINGRKMYSGNVSPCEFTWDTTKMPNGLHRLEIETPYGKETRRVLVMNVLSSSTKE